MDGIARLLTGAEQARYAPFLAHYRRVRAVEGWAVDIATLRALPYVSPDAPHAGVWRRRAWSYERLLACLRAWWPGHRLDVVDLGAGNCWLSGRLASLGHRVEAVDLNDDAGDGLGSARHEGVNRVQASMESLPYADGQFDLAVAAASLHHASDLAAVVREAARALRPDGALIVMDTPIYRTASAGRAAARREAMQRWRFGSDGEGTAGPGYIERAALRCCMEEAGLDYAEVPLHDPVRALLGRARRAGRRLLGRQERGQMPLVVGRKWR